MRKIIVIVCMFAAVTVGFFAGCMEQPGVGDYEDALSAFEEGNYVRAKALMENAINKNPGSTFQAEAYNWLGMMNWNLELFAEAVDAFEDSRRINPDFVTPTYNLALLMYKSGDVDQAKMLLQEAALMNGRETRALEYLAGIYMEQQNWQEAAQLLYEALDRNPESPRILTSLALVQRKTEGSQAAVDYLSQALEVNAAYAPALYDLATIYKNDLGEPEDARAYYRQFLEQETSGPYVKKARRALIEKLPARMPTPEPTPTLMSRPTATAVPTATPRPTPTATAVFREQPTVAPTPTVTPLPTSTSVPTVTPTPTATPVRKTLPEFDSLVKQAKDMAAKGDKKQALKPFMQAAKVALDNQRDDLCELAMQYAVNDCFDQPIAHFAYGKYLAAAGRHQDALNRMKQAAVLDPGSMNIRRAMADAATHAGEYDTALITLKKIVAIEPRDADAYWMMAGVYAETGAKIKAMQAYQEFIRMFPEDTRTLKAREKMAELNAAQKTEQRRTVRISDQKIEPVPSPTPTPKPLIKKRFVKPEEEEESGAEEQNRQLEFKKTVIRKKRAAIQAYNRGTYYHTRKDYDRAIYYYTRAIENDDSFAAAFYNLGSVYRETGDSDLAKDAYLRAIRLDENMIDARYNLALLYYELRQYTAAERQAQQILQREADNANAHMLLGLMYANNPRQRQKAIYHYTEYLKLMPDSRNARDIQRWLRENATQ